MFIVALNVVSECMYLYVSLCVCGYLRSGCGVSVCICNVYLSVCAYLRSGCAALGGHGRGGPVGAAVSPRSGNSAA